MLNPKKKVLIVSDTHGELYNFDTAYKRTKPDLVLHLGDIEYDEEAIRSMCICPVKIVKGNCDYGNALPTDDMFDLGIHRAWMTHGDRYNVKYDTDFIIRAAMDRGCDFVFFGHSHVPEETIKNGVTALNPGSLTFPRQAERVPTYIVLDVDEKGNVTYHFESL